MDHQINAVEIDMYMNDLTSQFCYRFQDFQHFDLLFFFLIKPESSEDLNLSASEWMDIENFQTQLINFKAFKEQKNILTCWESLQEKFCCLKKMEIALLSAFGSTYLCEQIFLHMKFILCAHPRRFAEDHLELYVHLQVSKFSSNITKLSKKKQGQGSY